MVAKRYEITSSQNETFGIFTDLLTSRGISKYRQAFIFGEKAVVETVKNFYDRCLGLVMTPEMEESSKETSHGASLYVLSRDLFKILDVFGTGKPVLLVKVPEFENWSVEIKSQGCTLLVPFQEPGNVGATLRSAAAFGIKNILMTEGVAHPFHPKSSRAASGALFSFRYFKTSRLEQAVFKNQTTVALDLNGTSLDGFNFPSDFILVPGLEGRGLPENFKPSYRVTIPINHAAVESLNGPVAVAIALYRRSVQKPQA